MMTTAIGAVVGGVLGKVLEGYLRARVIEQINIGLLVFIVILIVGLAASIKRNLTWKLRYLQENLPELFERRTQYALRQSHFPEEKAVLVDELVRHVLPGMIRDHFPAKIEHPDRRPQKIGVIVDSGTTLAPFFPRVRRVGRRLEVPKNVPLRIYTNSLAGIEMFHRAAVAGEIEETDLELFGGEPLEMYRATTGKVTESAMEAVRREYCDNGIVIGLITANWILIGQGYDKLILCAKGRGHLEYKMKLSMISNHLIVVAPLGKLLVLDTVEELNNILRAEGIDQYKGWDLSQRGEGRTYLLTTSRRRHRSILYPHSERLRIRHRNAPPWYKLVGIPDHLAFDPPASRREQMEIEVPQDYLRDHARDLLAILPP